MSGGFSNPIVGGGGGLVFPSIHSPNFNTANPMASPSPSWAILKTGLAYFFGLVLIGGTISGPDYVINAAGIFIYSGAPAAGNLIGSWAGAAGVDGQGNAYPQGLNVTAGAITGTTFSGPDYVINAAGIFIYSGAPAAGNLIGSWAGAAGVDAKGNAYPQGLNVTAGAITGTTFSGPDFIINAAGIFIYSGAPAAGNLIGSWAGAAGVDAKGNAYPQGLNVTAGVISGSTFSGPDLVINSAGMFVYSGAPAAGNLLLSVAAVSGTDAQGNNYIGPGVYVYNSSGGSVGLTPGANTALQLTPGITPTIVAGTAQVFANAAGHVVVQDGGDAQAYQTQRRTLVAGSNSGALTALSTIFAQSLGPQQYRVHGQLYVAVAVAGAEFQCKFLGSGTLTGQFAFTIEHGSGTNSVSQNGAPNTAVNTGTTQGVGVWVVTIDGTLAQTVAAVLDFQVGSATATSLVVNAQSFLEFMPV